MTLVATAPGKLILAGEYAVLDGMPALVMAVDRRVIARRAPGPRGSSRFLVALAEEMIARFGHDRGVLELAADSSQLHDHGHKLGLGSSAAVTVAATALALGSVEDRAQIFAIALAAHTRAQGGVGSGADVAAATHGGLLVYTVKQADQLAWPAGVTLIPFFTGVSADTGKLVAAFREARAARRIAVDAALLAIGNASLAAGHACCARDPSLAATGLLSGLRLAAAATDQLAAATQLPLVPACVHAIRAALTPRGGTAKTTGAGGGDVAIAVLPASEDAAIARRSIIEAGCQPLDLAVDQTGVDLQPNVQ